MANKKPVHVDEIVIDGQTVYIIKDRNVAESLVEIAENHLFMEEARRRLKRNSWLLGVTAGGLIGISKYWPQIDGVVRNILIWLGG